MKAALFDIDGVLIHYKQYFSSTLSTIHFNEPIKHLNSFYCSDMNKACDRGQKDPYTAIQPFLMNMGWGKTSREYFEEQWNYEKEHIDWTLLHEIVKLKHNGIKLIIASCQNPYRKAFLIQKMKLDTVFDKLYFSCDIGYLKEENGYWEYVVRDLENIKVETHEAIFFDDMELNIQKAQEHGIQGSLIKGKDDMWEALKILKETMICESENI